MKTLQVTGYKNTGKTTVINKMVKRLKSSGYRTAVIKHHHNGQAVYSDSTDTGKFIESGSDVTILNTTDTSMTVIKKEPDLNHQLDRLRGEVDFILIEGYKALDYPKIYLEYSFTDSAVPVEFLSLKSVLMTFDLRYDEDKLMEWFIHWSEIDEAF